MNHTFDFFECFMPNILIFKLVGFWRPDEDMKFKKVYNCYTILCTLVCVTFLVCQMTYFINNIQDVKAVTATLYISVTFTIDLIKVVLVYKNMNYLKILLKELNGPLFRVKCQKHYDIAATAKRWFGIFFKIILCLLILTDLCWVLVPFFSKEKIMTAKVWLPYDWEKPSNYIITSIFQNFELIWNSVIGFNVDMFNYLLLAQVGVQCDILCETLNCLDDFCTKNGELYEISSEEKFELQKNRDVFSEAMSKNLVVCIQHYREIKRVAKEIERINGTGIFILFLGGTLILCSSLFQLSVVKFGSVEYIMLLFYFICMIADQFFYCWFGNEVIYKSSVVLQSAYNTPWVDCDNKFRKILLQFMTQTCQPISILTGGLFTMSMQVFIYVMRSAYSYFTLLKNIQ